MAILKYFPPLLEVRDNRSQTKGYYEAECEVCGTKFFPKRSNAKYCTPKCAVHNHRKAIANGTAVKRQGGKIADIKKVKDITKNKMQPLSELIKEFSDIKFLLKQDDCDKNRKEVLRVGRLIKQRSPNFDFKNIK